MVATIEEVRERIENISNKQLRMLGKFQLQTACRISEVAGNYAIKPTDLTLTQYKNYELALWTIHTAKREGLERIVALPLSHLWVKELVDYFRTRKKKVFDYGVSSACHLMAKEFEGLTYRIEKYFPKKNVVVPSHERRMNTHALRHLRLSELVNVYGFDSLDLATFAGWKMSGMASRYVTMAWGRYIDKLLGGEKFANKK
ncbi:MAG: hypothetical protein ACUVT9_05460 [Candidatus Bathycorpusculaceae bacterium]